MIVCIILLSLGAISLALFLCEKVRKYSVKATLVKAVASLFFVALGLYGLLTKTLNLMGFCFVFAQVLGLLGDIFLDFKYVFKEQDRPFTYAGFIVFGLGHIFYVLGMYSQYYIQGHIWHILIPAIAAIVLGTGILFGGKLLKMDFKGMEPVALTYAILLALMFSTAFSLWMLNGFNNTTLMLIFIGGILFAISDIILCGTYFAENRERPVDIISNAITYYAAQFIIAFSLFFF